MYKFFNILVVIVVFKIKPLIHEFNVKLYATKKWFKNWAFGEIFSWKAFTK